MVCFSITSSLSLSIWSDTYSHRHRSRLPGTKACSLHHWLESRGLTTRFYSSWMWEQNNENLVSRSNIQWCQGLSTSICSYCHWYKVCPRSSELVVFWCVICPRRLSFWHRSARGRYLLMLTVLVNVHSSAIWRNSLLWTWRFQVYMGMIVIRRWLFVSKSLIRLWRLKFMLLCLNECGLYDKRLAECLRLKSSWTQSQFVHSFYRTLHIQAGHARTTSANQKACQIQVPFSSTLNRFSDHCLPSMHDLSSRAWIILWWIMRLYDNSIASLQCLRKSVYCRQKHIHKLKSSHASCHHPRSMLFQSYIPTRRLQVKSHSKQTSRCSSILKSTDSPLPFRLPVITTTWAHPYHFEPPTQISAH